MLHRLAFASFLSQLSMLLHGTGVRGGLGVNAFRQLHLNIKSNLPPPFCSGAFAEHVMTNSVSARLERVKEQMKLIG